MSLFDRIANLTKATLHEALNKLEDPVLMTGQYLRNLEEEIHSAEKMLKEQQMTASIQQRKSEDAAQLAKQSELRAIASLENGDNNAARHAAAAKIQYEEQSQQYAAEATAARDRVLELELRIKSANEEYERLKEKRNELAARARKVNDNSKMKSSHISYGFETGSAAKGFERMEEKILEWEAGQQLAGESFGNGTPGSTSGASESAAVNAELQRMKEQLNSRSNQDNNA
ncbi:phage shock protein A [Fontibacillus solani]|uniref:Phage shock protein A n=1 Tax=Fontibacillus solani TaxID=1572857 RepID=A0A7W3SPA8_9BACL|nr:PspA/IM30 family protein [Fontibacillus solani]MBA9083633.1 phage shock protein A [Fontibacillus solani]